MIFRTEKVVRFHHCDPAGIVFYPQYFYLLHELVEDWFSQGLGVDFADLIGKQGKGVPLVKIDCEFVGTNRLGDVLTLELGIKHLGRTSITLAIKAIHEGRECVRASMTLVHATLRPTPKSTPIDALLRAAMERFLME